MTGHTSLGIVFDDPETEVLEKPFTPRTLAHKVRRVLDQRANLRAQPDQCTAPGLTAVASDPDRETG